MLTWMLQGRSLTAALARIDSIRFSTRSGLLFAPLRNREFSSDHAGRLQSGMRSPPWNNARYCRAFVPSLAMESTTVHKEAPAATKAANKPMKSFRLHGVSVSVFANTVKIQDREKTFYKVTMSKSWRDDEGQLQRTTSFDSTDIPLLSALLAQAYDAVIQQNVVVTERESEE